MGLFDSLIRGAEVATPALAAIQQGQRLSEEDRRKQEEAEREATLRRRTVEMAIERLDLDKAKERRASQPVSPTARVQRGGVSVDNVALDQVDAVRNRLPQDAPSASGSVQTITGEDGTVYTVRRNADGTEDVKPLMHNGQPLRARQPQSAGVNLQLTPTADGFGAFNPRTGQIQPVAGARPAPRAGGSLNAVDQRVVNENTALTAEIDNALSLLQQHGNSVGLQNALPEFVTQRRDPEGIPLRAAISNIGSLITLQRSGGAVSDAEFERIAPFIPKATDSAEAVAQKLNFLRQYVQNKTRAMTGGMQQTPAASFELGGDVPAPRYRENPY